MSQLIKFGLKPCPFCGKAASLQINGGSGYEYYEIGCTGKKCATTMKDDYLFSNGITYTIESREEKQKKLCEKWNTRV